MADVTNKEAFDALGEAYDALDKAYWAASTLTDKDRIYGLSTVILDEYNNMAREGLAENAGKYRGASDALRAAKTKVAKLRDDINDMVHAIAIATQVVKVLGKVLAFL